MTELSPAARAVWEAAMNIPDHMPYEHDIAAALRAASNYLTSAKSEDKLRAIADELEGIEYHICRDDL